MREVCDIRPYQEGDEKEILKLFTLAYGGREMTLPFWRWRFCNNPSGKGVIELGWDYDTLAAHYAVTNSTMEIGGRYYLTGLSGTTMTNPIYRRRGLFSTLARRAYQEMTNRNMVMVWGFPNAMSHNGFVHDLGWQDIYEIPVLRLGVASEKVILAIRLNKICELTGTDERFDKLWKRVRKDYDIIVRRDQSYILWRYFSNPSEKYRLIAFVENEEIHGYAVFKRYQDELQVVDLLAGKEDVEVGVNLIAYIVNEALNAGMVSISLWLNLTHPFHCALETMGFKPEGPVTYLGGLVLNPQLNASIYDFRRWYFTMADSDVF